MPKVSIVLPSFNGEKFIRESIESVINQSFSDWELIIVDDCSTDNTPSIVDEYAEKDIRIRVIHNSLNQKLPRSLNIGFKEARGEYLTWTSDDNFYHTDAIEKMYNFLMQHLNYVMVSARMNCIDSEKKFLRLSVGYDEKQIYKGNCVGACFLYRREVLSAVGDYATDLFCVEDYDYWLRILKVCGKIGCIKEILYEYRIHDGSLTVAKRNYVKDQLLRLKYKNADWLLDIHADNSTFLCELYYELISGGFMTSALQEKFEVRFDVLGIDNIELPISSDARFVIFGAGNVGREALEYIGEENVTCFVDSSLSLQGSHIQGIRVIPPDDIADLNKAYIIMVAVGGNFIGEVLSILRKANVNSCIVYQRFVAYEERK